MNVKPIVTFRELASDNTMCPLSDNLAKIQVNVEAVKHYMDEMKALTGGTDVEFNNTFRALCKDRVFYAFNPVETTLSFENNPEIPEVVECVLLSDNTVAMNINGNVTIMYPEEANCMWATLGDAAEAAKENALEVANDTLDDMCKIRKELKKELKEYSARIDAMLAFKHSLTH